MVHTYQPQGDVEHPPAREGLIARGGASSWAVRRGVLVGLDAAAAVAAVLLLGAVPSVAEQSGQTTGLALAVFVPFAWVASVAAQGGYRSAERQRFGTRARILVRAAAWFLAASLVISVAAQSLVWAGWSLALTGVMLVASMTFGWAARTLHAARSHADQAQLRVFVVGSPRSIEEYTTRLEQEDGEQASRIVGSMAPAVPKAEAPDASPSLPSPREPMDELPKAAEEEDDGSTIEPVSVVAQDIVRRAQAVNASDVAVLGGADLTSTDYRDLAWLLEEQGLGLSIVPVTWDVAPHRMHMEHVSGLSPVVVRNTRDHPVGFAVKSVLDRVVSGFALLFLAPIMAVISLVIRLDSKGPAIFRQERVGRDGQVFTMLKFRSMVADAEDLKARLKAQSKHGDGLLFKMEQDPRITRVGSVLRKLSLDELPQLFNVFFGQMSLVGPRPALPEEVAAYDERTQRRLAVRPGVTGLWQVSGRSDLNWATSVDLDLRYIERWSVSSDMSILARTVGVVVARKGAY